MSNNDVELLWNFHQICSPLCVADALVCLCSYDLRVADRAAELMQNGFAEICLVTGYRGNWTKDIFDEAEATLFASRMQELGVPRDVMLLDTTATNIGENIQNAKVILEKVKPIRGAVIFVTKPQTQKRVYATAVRRWLEIRPLVTAPQLSMAEQLAGMESERRLIEEMVGDLDRIIRYPGLGYQINLPIPRDVLDAYRRLCESGYDAHCLPI